MDIKNITVLTSKLKDAHELDDLAATAVQECETRPVIKFKIYMPHQCSGECRTFSTNSVKKEYPKTAPNRSVKPNNDLVVAEGSKRRDATLRTRT